MIVTLLAKTLMQGFGDPLLALLEFTPVHAGPHSLSPTHQAR
jgi:hypothetical protein